MRGVAPVQAVVAVCRLLAAVVGETYMLVVPLLLPFFVTGGLRTAAGPASSHAAVPGVPNVLLFLLPQILVLRDRRRSIRLRVADAPGTGLVSVSGLAWSRLGGGRRLHRSRARPMRSKADRLSVLVHVRRHVSVDVLGLLHKLLVPRLQLPRVWSVVSDELSLEVRLLLHGLLHELDGR
uniref:Putative secreted protein n=1 Tax=Ixodes ricinus TaxID=34613 RepID=A0A6B0UZY6_IXORI